MKMLHLAVLAGLVQVLPAWAVSPTATMANTTLPCEKTKAGCPKTMAAPRGDDPGIMPSQAKKPVARAAVKPVEAKPAVVAPQIKPDKAAAPK